MSEWKQHYRSGCAAFRSHDYVRAERELTMVKIDLITQYDICIL